MSEINRVGFGGITMDRSDRLSADGDMEVLDNLRHRSGSLIPFAPNPVEYESDLEIVYIHENMGYEHWIGYDESTMELYYEAYRNELGKVVRNEGDTRLIGRLGGRMLSISSIGNVLVVNTEGGNFYAIWSDGLYNETSIPELPYIGISINSYYSFGKYYNTGPEISLGEYYSNSYKDALGGKVAEFLSGNNKIFYPVLVRVAFETINGYVNHSNIFPVCSEYTFKENGDLVNMRYEDDRSTSTSIMCLLGIRAKSGSQSGIVVNIRERFRAYSFSLIVPPIPGNKLITSLAISVSKQLYRLSDTAWHHKTAEYTSPTFPYTESVAEAITLTNNANEYGDPGFDAFYIVKKIPIEEFKNGKTITFEDVDFSDSALAVREVLPDYDGGRDVKIFNNLFKYNNRLHAFGLTEKIFSGFPYDNYTVKQSKFNGVSMSTGASGVKRIEIAIKLETDMGYVIIERTDMSARSIYYYPFVSYPDRRAKEMNIIYTIDSKLGVYTRRVSIPLTKHPILNLAYHCKPSFIPSTISILSGVTGEFMNELNAISKQENLFYVSQINNPFLFPPENVYSAGDGNVIGLGVATSSLSEGQFGQFPLYVFTDEGIWMMQQGAGDVIYASAQPMSREVCNNPDSITSLDNAVAFTTDKGLMVVKGSTVEEISRSLRSDIGERCGRARLYDEFTDWAGFWKSARIGYNYQEEEIFVADRRVETVQAEGETVQARSVQWVYGLRSGAWKRRNVGDNAVRFYVSNYPELYSSRVRTTEVGGTVCVYHNESKLLSRADDGSLLYVPFLWRTRPMKLGSTQFKKLLRAVVRVTMNGWGRLKIYGCSSIDDDGGRIASRKLMYEAVIAKERVSRTNLPHVEANGEMRHVEGETVQAPSVQGGEYLYTPVLIDDIRSRVLGCGFRYWVVEMSGECAVGESWFDFLEIETEDSLRGKLR